MTGASYLRSIAGLGKESLRLLAPPHVPQAGLRQAPVEPLAAPAARDSLGKSETLTPPSSEHEEREPEAYASMPPVRPRQANHQPAVTPAPLAPKIPAPRREPDAIHTATLPSDAPVRPVDVLGKPERHSPLPAPPLEPAARWDIATPPPARVAATRIAPPQLLAPPPAPLPPRPSPLGADRGTGNTIRIGAIDVHITPPPRALPKTARPRTAPVSGLSRGFLAPFGLRQG